MLSLIAHHCWMDLSDMQHSEGLLKSQCRLSMETSMLEMNASLPMKSVNCCSQEGAEGTNQV